jgi:hypothetical protein
MIESQNAQLAAFGNQSFPKLKGFDMLLVFYSQFHVLRVLLILVFKSVYLGSQPQHELVFLFRDSVLRKVYRGKLFGGFWLIVLL